MKDLFKRRRKVVVLGIDGVPCTLLRRFTAAGVMPNLARLVEQGSLSPMSVSIPEVSSTSWSTFMTGVNPGKHGIFGFIEVRRDTYGWRFPNFADLRCRTLWDLAGDAGLTSVVINMPSTYPARPLRGVLVSGFVALDLKQATYPERVFTHLRDSGYRLDVDSTLAVKSVEAFTADIARTFAKRTEAILHLLANEEWDLFIGTVTETDRLHHYLWDALDDAAHPQHDFFLSFYRDLDAFIGEFSRRVGPDVPFLILSDHGFTRIKQEVYLNGFLREKGYLGFTAARPESLSQMDERSRAFALDPSRIYIHRQGVYARGTVPEQDAAELRESLRRDLAGLQHEGSPVVRQVYRKEELYSGDCIGAAPDLVLLAHDGYDLKGTLSKTELFGRSRLSGAHTREDATFFVNRRVDSQDINILDASATIVQLLGLPAAGLEGRSLL